MIAHEFSHILNGDTRINIRLIAILFGIIFIGLVGNMLLRGSRLWHRPLIQRTVAGAAQQRW